MYFLFFLIAFWFFYTLVKFGNLGNFEQAVGGGLSAYSTFNPLHIFHNLTSPQNNFQHLLQKGICCIYDNGMFHVFSLKVTLIRLDNNNRIMGMVLQEVVVGIM